MISVQREPRREQELPINTTVTTTYFSGFFEAARVIGPRENQIGIVWQNSREAAG
jgi:hypothetical protein